MHTHRTYSSRRCCCCSNCPNALLQGECPSPTSTDRVLDYAQPGPWPSSISKMCVKGKNGMIIRKGIRGVHKFCVNKTEESGVMRLIV